MRKVKGITAVVLTALMVAFMVAAPAQACACGGYDPAGWVANFNQQDALYRCSANVGPPAGYAWGYACLMVPTGY